jgi:hypothetical protein
MRLSNLTLACAALAALSAALPMVWLWGFTVDDALISARVAHQLATGHGYRFNASGPVVDAVTPLGWAPLLTPFAAGGPWAAMVAAKWLGAGAWLIAAVYLGVRLCALGTRALVVGSIALLTTIPLAAWAVAGMETGLVTALATFALGSGNGARLALGLAAGLRPELAPWALMLTLGDAVLWPGTAKERVRRAFMGLAFAFGPFVLVAMIRQWLFGAAYPLSLLAKPSDFSSGLRYGLGGLAFTGPFWLLAAGPAWKSVSGRSRVLALAALVHVVALIIAGGDWMALYRLFVPVLPSVILLGAELSRASPITSGVRVLFALLASAQLALFSAPSARAVGDNRRELVDGAGPWLRGAERVATLDVGWVGAATSATVIDLAGVTDPTVARLPGGHTSKRLPDSFLESRQVDALVLLVDIPMFDDSDETPILGSIDELPFARTVEKQVPLLASAERFRSVGFLPLRGARQSYVIARRER